MISVLFWRQALSRLCRFSFFSLLLGALFSGQILADVRSYKVGSWNLDGLQIPIEEKWNNTIRALLNGSNGVDVLALQEVGALPANVKFLNTFTLPYAATIPIQEYQWDQGKGQEKVFIYFVRTDASMKAINLAIVSKRRANEVFIIKPSGKRSGTPMLGILLDSSAIITMDSYHKSGADVLPNIINAQEFFAAHPQVQNLDWLIAGSFNLHPQALQAKLPPKLQEHVALISPAVPTRKSGGVLDYAIGGNSAESPYAIPPIKAYLGYGSLRLQFDSDQIPLIFSK